MHQILTFFLGLSLVYLPFARITNAEGRNIDDLLIPEVPTKYEQNEAKKESTQRSQENRNIEDLLGPKEIFPFLPDNHRDSGTGKFNSY